MTLANIAILRADNSSQYQLSSQTGARSARHSLRPQTRSRMISQTDSNHALRIDVEHNSELSCLVKGLDNPEFEKLSSNLSHI